MSEKEISAFSKEVASVVANRRKRQEVEAELLDHMECLKERYIATGLSLEEAEEKAVHTMGDKEKLKQEFKMLYPVNPNKYWKNSLYLVFFGILLSFLQVDWILPYVGAFIRVLSLVLLGLGILRLRELHKSIQVSFGLYAFSACLATVWLSLAHYFVPSEPQFLKVRILGGVVGFFFLLSYAFLFFGLEKTAWTYRTAQERSPYFWLSGLILCAFQIQLWVIADNVIQSGDFASAAFSIFPLLSVLLLLFLALGFFRLERIIGSSEKNLDVQHPVTKKGYIFFSLGAVFLLLLSCGAMVGAAYRQPALEPLPVKVDSTVLEATEKVKAMGFPEEYLADLPKEEIDRLAKASRMEALQKETAVSETSAQYKNQIRDHVTLDVFAFYFDDEQGHVPKIRLVYCYSGFENRTAPYRNGLAVPRNASNVIVGCNMPKQANDPAQDVLFFTSAANVNGKRYSCAPIVSVNYESNLENSTYTDFAFPKQAENCRAYLAVTLWRQYYGGPSYLNFQIDFLEQQLPLCFHHYTMHAFAASAQDLDWTFDKHHENLGFEVREQTAKEPE